MTEAEKDRRISVVTAGVIGMLDGYDYHIVDGEPYLNEDMKARIVLTAFMHLNHRKKANKEAENASS